jgi:hypothetical protein
MSIDSFLQTEKSRRLESRIARAKSAAGRFASSAADGSAKHDQYLTAAFGQKKPSLTHGSPRQTRQNRSES